MELKKFSDFSLNESKKKITKKLLKNLWDLYYNKFLDKSKELIEDGDIDEDDLVDFLQHHLEYFKEHNLNIKIIDGIDWEERTQKAIKILENYLYI